MSRPACIICGGKNDSSVNWQSFCTSCAKQTWGAAVIAKFIENTINCQERLAAAELTINGLWDKIEELEKR